MGLTFLSVQLTSSTALTTWRMMESGKFECYTSWTVNQIEIESQAFGNTLLSTNEVDITNVDPSLLPFDVLLLGVPTLRDVKRICQLIEPLVGPDSLVLVDVSGGYSLVQRQVRAALAEKAQICAAICGATFDLTMSEAKRYRVLQYGSDAVAVHIEPASPRAAEIQTALVAAGVGVGTEPLDAEQFARLQWEATISAVAFELVGIVLEIPSIENLAKDIVAKPLVEGCIAELSAIARTCGADMPSVSELIESAPAAVQRAPPTFEYAHASKLFYDYYRRGTIALDSILLLPILLSAELGGGRTPYLECTYAIASRLLQLNTRTREQGILYQRLDFSPDSDATPKRAVPAVVAALESEKRALEKQLTEFSNAYAIAQEELKTARSRVTPPSLAGLSISPDGSAREISLQREERVLERRREQLEKREAAVAEKESTYGLRMDALAQREALVVQAEEAAARTEASLVQREALLSQREAAQAQREWQAERQARKFASSGSISYVENGPSAMPLGPHGRPPPQAYYPGPLPSSSQAPPQGPAQGGTPPRTQHAMRKSQSAPVAGNHTAYSAHRAKPSYGQRAGPPRGPPGGCYGDMHGVVEQPRRGSRAGPNGPNGLNGPGGPGGPGGSSGRRKGSAAGGQPFSQNFQLDSVSSFATDRYGFVSRGKRALEDPNLSADQQTAPPRPYAHGLTHSGAPGQQSTSTPTSPPSDLGVHASPGPHGPYGLHATASTPPRPVMPAFQSPNAKLDFAYGEYNR